MPLSLAKLCPPLPMPRHRETYSLLMTTIPSSSPAQPSTHPCHPQCLLLRGQLNMVFALFSQEHTWMPVLPPARTVSIYNGTKLSSQPFNPKYVQAWVTLQHHQMLHHCHDTALVTQWPPSLPQLCQHRSHHHHQLWG